MFLVFIAKIPLAYEVRMRNCQSYITNGSPVKNKPPFFTVDFIANVKARLCQPRWPR